MIAFAFVLITIMFFKMKREKQNKIKEQQKTRQILNSFK